MHEANVYSDLCLYFSDGGKAVTSPDKPFNSHHLIPIVDLDERNGSTLIEPGGNSVQNLDPHINNDDLANDSEDELNHLPSWYRFGASSTTNSTNNLPDEKKTTYVMQVRDAYREREFHDLIGKEYLDGEVHYMVVFTPILVRGSVLMEAQAEPLITCFEARCQTQLSRSSSTIDQSAGSKTLGRISQKAMGGRIEKRRGRPRKLVREAQRLDQGGPLINLSNNPEVSRGTLEKLEQKKAGKPVLVSREPLSDASRGALSGAGKEKRQGRPRKPPSQWWRVR